MPMERLAPGMHYRDAPPQELRAEGTEGPAARVIQGYASSWARDSYGTQMAPGAFAKTIAADRLARGDIKLMWQHCEPIGLVTYAEERAEGLWVKATVSAVDDGDEALVLLADRVVNRFSVGFNVPNETWSWDAATETVIFREVELKEVSLVTFAGTPNTLAEIGRGAAGSSGVEMLDLYALIYGFRGELPTRQFTEAELLLVADLVPHLEAATEHLRQAIAPPVVPGRLTADEQALARQVLEAFKGAHRG